VVFPWVWRTILSEAAATAAATHPVVAVWKPPTGWSPPTEHGHIALILPGGVADSGWGVKVPRAAQMSIDHPNDAFIGCRVCSTYEPMALSERQHPRDQQTGRDC
jgi:hypothetical protein